MLLPWLHSRREVSEPARPTHVPPDGAPPLLPSVASHRRSWLTMAVGTTGARATTRPPLKRSSSRSAWLTMASCAFASLCQVPTTVPNSTSSRATESFLRASASTSSATLDGWARFPGSMQAQASGDGRFARPICSQRQPRQRKGQRGGTVRLEQGRTQQQSRVLQMHADGVLCPEEAMCCMESMNVACWVLRAGGT